MKEATSVCPIEKDGKTHGMQDILSKIDCEKDMDDFIWEYIGDHGGKTKHTKGEIQYSPFSGLASTNNLVSTFKSIINIQADASPAQFAP